MAIGGGSWYYFHLPMVTIEEAIHFTPVCQWWRSWWIRGSRTRVSRRIMMVSSSSSFNSAVNGDSRFAASGIEVLYNTPVCQWWQSGRMVVNLPPIVNGDNQGGLRISPFLKMKFQKNTPYLLRRRQGKQLYLRLSMVINGEDQYILPFVSHIVRRRCKYYYVYILCLPFLVFIVVN